MTVWTDWLTLDSSESVRLLGVGLALVALGALLTWRRERELRRAEVAQVREQVTTLAEEAGALAAALERLLNVDDAQLAAVADRVRREGAS